jgi:hypothetical protein
LIINCNRFEGENPFHTQHNITTTHGNREHVGFEMIITHLEFDILTTPPTLHHTTICDEDLKITNRVDKAMELLNDPVVNKIMGATIINQHHNLIIFYVSLNLHCQWGQNT